MKRLNLSVLGLLVLLLLLALSGILFLPIPFTRDQGIYAYVAWCWLGEWWPYQYAFEHKGPWLYLLYALFLQLSRGAMWGPNLADLLSRMTTVALLWLLGKKVFNEKLAFLVSLFAFFPLLSIFSSCWWNAQAETFIIPLSTLSVLCAWSGIKNPGAGFRNLFSLASGLILSQILMLKPSGFFLILGLLFFFARFSEEKKKTLLIFFVGIFLGLSLWLAYFWWRGIGREFWEEVILFNLFHFSGVRKSPQYLAVLFGWELWKIFGWGLILAPVGFWQVLRKWREPGFFLVLVWFCATFLEVLVQARFFLYHLLVLIPSGALLLALGTWGWEGKSSRFWKAFAGIIVLLWAIGAIRIYFSIQKHYQTLDYLKGKIDRGQYYARFQEPLEGSKRDFNTYASWVVANWIRERTLPKDYVLIFGYEPGINYLSARRAPSRFHSDYPLNFTPGNKFARTLRTRFRSIFLSELAQRKPKLVVVVHNDVNALEPTDSYHQAQSFPEFWDYLLKNYQPGERIEDFEFFWRIKE